MRYHNITKDDMLNGEGLRTVLWVAGCSHNCPQCHNPVTWDINGGLAFDEAAKEELFEELKKDYISGVTFSGGDPLHEKNRKEIEKLAEDIEKCDFRIPEKNNGISLVVPTENGYQVKMKKEQGFEVAVPEQKEKDGVLFVQFRIENKKPKEDIEISLEGERNKLSSIQHVYYNRNTVFTYAVGLEKGQKTVRLSLGKGEYTIKDMSAYNGVLNEDTGLYQSVFRMDKEQTKGNLIQGRIKSQKDGMFITSIPFDKGFEMTIDGVKVKCEKVNKAFLGFHLEAGKHKIRILYHAPGVTAGKILTGLGVLIVIAGAVRKKKCAK